MKDLTTRSLPKKSLKHQKIYLFQGLFNIRYIKICESICLLNRIFQYLTYLPIVGMSQKLSDKKIEPVGITLT